VGVRTLTMIESSVARLCVWGVLKLRVWLTRVVYAGVGVEVDYPQGLVKPMAADAPLPMRAGIVMLAAFTSVPPRPESFANGMLGGLIKSNLNALSGSNACRVIAFGDVRSLAIKS
jgi:hypothetical protein